ncbi:MAG: 16S rRNA (cytidine(1402)-2'-O)-methyltransferase [Candidatus Obscuribacterales bacterium]|nr:16S rRNA (cytidine(1402)-2'-O)-methyltransferase [Candidatus Obscuribacterales bacterium]
MSGELYIIGTPIGNLQDISSRTKDLLAKVDFVLAEDTRVSIKLLRHLGLNKKLVSCHDHNEESRGSVLAEAAAGDLKVALISDAGMPLVSDPGYKILQKALALDMNIIPIPGPSAPLLALVGSGLPVDRFSFEGFLPDKKGDRLERLQKIKADDRTLIFFVAPSNLAKIIDDILTVFGDRKVCLARELTKLHEEYIRLSARELAKLLPQRELKGECVLVVAGASQADPINWSEADVTLKLQEMVAAGARMKDACNVLAKESGWSASDLYKLGLKMG